jgi:hypothetical protein
MLERPRDLFRDRPHRRGRAHAPGAVPPGPIVPPRTGPDAPTPPATSPRRAADRPRFKRDTKALPHAPCDRGGHYDRGIWQGPF